MAIVYGDSTLFPYEENFIEISKDLIDCCVSLLMAQHTLATSTATTRERELHRKTETQKLEALTDAMRRAVITATGDRARKISGSVFEAARAVIDREVSDLEAQTAQEIAAARAQAEDAKQSSYKAVEAFLLKHALPKTSHELRLTASEKAGYTAKTWMISPFGVEALFAVAVPPPSDWNKPRRVGDINPGTEVQMPQSAGWISKRIELQAVRLDKLFISELIVGEEKTTISLRKTPTTGSGYLLEILVGGTPKVTIATLGEDGLPTETARTLSGDDYSHGLRLWTKLMPTTGNINRRQAMLSASYAKKPLQENDMPEAIGLRLIQILTPILKEIAKRSLAPGELILRRDLGEGRREELYATKAEFHERIKNLPETFQLLFDPLELSASPKAAFSGSGLLRMNTDLKQRPQGPVPSNQVEDASPLPTSSGQVSTVSPLPVVAPPMSASQSLPIMASPVVAPPVVTPPVVAPPAITPPPITPPPVRNTPSSAPSGAIPIVRNTPTPTSSAGPPATPRNTPAPTQSGTMPAPATRVTPSPSSGAMPRMPTPNNAPPPTPAKPAGAPDVTAVTALPLPASLKASKPAPQQQAPKPAVVPPAYITQEIQIQPFDDDEVSQFLDEEATKIK